jgi:hypothetical protein
VDKGIKESGIVNIGRRHADGSFSSLVILENSSYTVKESFAKGSTEGEDDRIRLSKGTPITVDLYVQIAVPQDKDLRNSIFAQITPTAVEGQDRVMQIPLQTIYDRLAKMSVRGKTREVFTKYETTGQVMSKYKEVTAEIAVDITNIFKETNSPLELVSVSLGNVKEDVTVLKAQSQIDEARNLALAINEVGNAIRNNPGYLEKLKFDTLKEIGLKSSNLIIMDTNKSVVLPVGK